MAVTFTVTQCVAQILFDEFAGNITSKEKIERIKLLDKEFGVMEVNQACVEVRDEVAQAFNKFL